MRKLLSANAASAGWTGKAFGFSLSRGANAHFGGTGRLFEEGVKKFVRLGQMQSVDVVFPSVDGKITIIGKLAND